jgi:hypothetical protein
MNGTMTRSDRDQIKPQGYSRVLLPVRAPPGGGPFNPVALFRSQGLQGGVHGGAGLDFHKTDHFTPAGDQVQFSNWCFQSTVQDPIPFQAQPQHGQSLCPSPACFRFLPCLLIAAATPPKLHLFDPPPCLSKKCRIPALDLSDVCCTTILQIHAFNEIGLVFDVVFD